MSTGMIDRAAAFLFRHRGLVPVLPILYALIAADPGGMSLGLGLGLMGVGEGVRLWAAAHLGGTTRSSSVRAEKLVTRGPYAHTRHPLYWGNLALVVGFCLASGAGRPWFPALAGLGFVLLYGKHARREEAALGSAFPDSFDAYAARVPRFRWAFPGREAEPGGDPGPPSWKQAFWVELGTLHAELWVLFLLWASRWWRGGS
jgi:protein-S-isoprenylcysteine O-methyltransferase Ste14